MSWRQHQCKTLLRKDVQDEGGKWYLGILQAFKAIQQKGWRSPPYDHNVIRHQQASSMSLARLLVLWLAPHVPEEKQQKMDLNNNQIIRLICPHIFFKQISKHRISWTEDSPWNHPRSISSSNPFQQENPPLNPPQVQKPRWGTSRRNGTSRALQIPEFRWISMGANPWI